MGLAAARLSGPVRECPGRRPARGETPFYLSDLDAHARIRRAVPDAKLIAVLRDPVDRAYSNWTHLWSDGLEPIGNFLDACAEEERRKEAGWAPFWRYTELGRYGDQLQHLFDHFPPEQVHVLRYRDLVDQPQHTLGQISAFLGVDGSQIREVPPRNVSTYVHPTPANHAIRGVLHGGAAVGQFLPPQVWRTISTPLLSALQRGQRNRPELSAADRQRLIAVFADDVLLLERLTGMTFQDWLGHRVGGTYSVRKSGRHRAASPRSRADGRHRRAAARSGTAIREPRGGRRPSAGRRGPRIGRDHGRPRGP